MARGVKQAERAAESAALLGQLLGAREALLAQDVGRELGWRAARVREELERLRGMGCELEEYPQGGVGLARTGLAVWEDYLRWRLGPGAKGRIIQVYRQTSSTQDVARRMAKRAGAKADGALAVADHQTAGRGRLGRKWYAPAGSCVLFSRVCAGAAIAAKSQAGRAGAESFLSADRLVFATSLAIARGIEAAARGQVRVQIKWPNDLLVEGSKIAGILVETLPMPVGKDQRPEAMGRAAVVGVGINVTLEPAAVPKAALEGKAAVTSLAACGVEVDRLAVLAEAVAAMDAALVREDVGLLLEEWRQRSVLLGQRISARSGGHNFRGEVVDLDPLEGLILRTPAGGHVHLSAQTTMVV